MVGGGEGEHENGTWAPIGAPLNVQRDDHHHHQQQQQHWSNSSSSNFDSSVNAVSFGFVATAILISMFLIMAILERFLRPPSSPDLLPAVRRNHRRVFQPPRTPSGKQLSHPSPKMSLYTSWVSVLMPGDETPTFIAHPAPAPCGPEQISWPSHQHHKTLSCSTSNILPNTINQV